MNLEWFSREDKKGVNKYWVDFNDFQEKWVSKLDCSYTEDEIEKPTTDEIELYNDMKKYNV